MADKLTTIVIPDDETTSRFANGIVPIPVNGKIANLKVGEKTEVGEHIIGALEGAGVNFTVVEPEGTAEASAGGVHAGASFSADDTRQKSITPVTDRNTPNGTVQNDEQAGDPGSDHALREPEELIDTPAPEGARENAAGGVTLENGVNSADGDFSNTLGGDAGEQGAEGGEQQGDDEPGPLDGSIPALVEHLKTVNDMAEIDRLIAAEKGGKSRVGAQDALEARKAELAAQ